MKSTMSLAVMALLGYYSSLEVHALSLQSHHHHHRSPRSNSLAKRYTNFDSEDSQQLVQMQRMDFDNDDDSDKFMAESIAEAEKEFDMKKKGKKVDLTSQIQQLEKESNSQKTVMPDDAEDRKKISRMAEDMVDGALTSKSSVVFNGNSVDVDTVDASKDTKRIEDDNKAAIKEALKDRSGELGINLDEKKEKKDSAAQKTEKPEEGEKSHAQTGHKHKKKHSKKHHKKDDSKKEEEEPKKSLVQTPTKNATALATPKNDTKQALAAPKNDTHQSMAALASNKTALAAPASNKTALAAPAENKTALAAPANKSSLAAPANKTSVVQVSSEEAHKKHKKHHKKHQASSLLQEKKEDTADPSKADEHQKEAVQREDIFNEEENEDAEIMKSIQYAENKLGSKMGTPQVINAGQRRAPLKYDVEGEDDRIDSKSLGSLV